jgi:hypothetical protein
MGLTSLTPIIIKVLIYIDLANEDGSSTRWVFLDTETTSDIFVSSVSYSTVINAVPEATVSLGFNSQSGLEKMRNLFPSQGHNTKSYTCEISIIGNETNHSTVPETLNLFKGQIIGYGINSSVGGYAYNLNIKGLLHPFQEISLGTPGMHGSINHHIGSIVPYSFTDGSRNVAKSKSNNEQANFFISLRRELSGIQRQLNPFEGFGLYRLLLDFYVQLLRDTFKSSSSEAGDLNRQVREAFQVAIEAYFGGLNAAWETKNPFQDYYELEYDKSGVAIDDYDLVASLIFHFTSIYLQNPSHTFWDLLMGTISMFGLSIINYGPGIVGVVDAPLLNPNEFTYLNKIKKGDIISFQISDFPFHSPTRVILSTRNSSAYYGRLDSRPVYGVFPKSSDDLKTGESGSEIIITEDEKVRGPRIVFYQAPAFLAYYIKETVPISTQNLLDTTSLKKAASEFADKAGTVGPVDIDKSNDDVQLLADKYAKYIYTIIKHKERVGSITTRYMPNLIAGLPCLINDPSSGMNIQCVPLAVRHNIDCNAGNAYTNATLHNVRYEFEVGGNLSNPFYPDYSLKTTENMIVDSMGIKKTWLDLEEEELINISNIVHEDAPETPTEENFEDFHDGVESVSEIEGEL